MQTELPRAYLFKLAPEMNSGKRAALEELHVEWQRTLPLAFDWYWRPFLSGGLMPMKPPRTGPRASFPSTTLVSSQKDLMALAIESQARGWASNLARRIARALMSDAVLALNPVFRRELLWVNSMKAWLLPFKAQQAVLAAQPAKRDALEAISPQASRVMRKMVRRYIELHRLPDPKQLPLQVNQLSATWASAQRTKVGWAPRWLRVSTLTRGVRVSLPVMGNSYADERPGRHALTFSLVKRDEQWFVLSTKYVQPTPWADGARRTDVLAIDVGLRNLMATSEGDICGAGYLTTLQRYDDQLLKLQKGLQQAGLKRLSQCRRYRLLVARLQGFMKTQMQTHLNRLLARHRPRKVVIEDLLFAGEPGLLSKRMNRLLRRFGQRFFTETLAQRQAEFGFELELVEPAYTSQTCAACGFVHRASRQGDNFKCKSCGHLAHADVNAAKNQARRSGAGAHPLPGGRHAWRVRSLQTWAARLATTLKDTSGSSRHHRAAACARAGLAALQPTKQTGAKLLKVTRPDELLGLLNGFMCGAAPRYSTRESG